MPDFIIQYNQVCASNLYWSKKVKGSKGEVYEVYFGDHGFGSLDWSCSCPAYKYRRKDCKHILAAQKDKCDWGKEAFCGNQTKANIDNTCPKCGGETEVIKVAV